MHIAMPKGIYKISDILKKHGFRVCLVGGAIRNIYGNFKTSDYDLATDAPAETVLSIFKRAIPTGIEHGTVTILIDGGSYEITTFRVEGGYSDKRHPDAVTYTDNLLEDLKRRDFTMNAIAYDIQTKDIVDPHGGCRDIDNRLIRAIGDPAERLSEDPLRILRGFRFQSQLGFSFDTATLDAVSKHAGLITGVSSERIRDEFSKLVLGKYSTAALLEMDNAGVLEQILPEITRTKGIQQKGFHNFDVFHHSIYALEWAPDDNLPTALAALLHDIGKKDTLSFNDGVPSFHSHEQMGSQIAGQILRRLKYPNAVRIEVTHLIRQHMFHYTCDWSDSAVRRFIKRVGKDSIDNLFILRRCDEYGFMRKPIDSPALVELKKRIEDELSKENALDIRDLNIDGNRLHSELGIPKNKQMGIILQELLEAVIDDPELNTAEQLLKIAESIYKKVT